VEGIFGSWYYNSLSSGWSPAIYRHVFIPQIREHVELTHSYGPSMTSMMTASWPEPCR